MTCEACDGKLERIRASIESPYRYRLSGLDNVDLAGITVHRCPACDTLSPTLPKLRALHACIAEALIDKPTLLTGSELRYLRKFVGLAAKVFAQRIRVDAAHLSRVENGHYEGLGRSTDKLVRVIAAEGVSPELLHDVVTDVRGELGELAADPPARMLFEYANGHWSTPSGEPTVSGSARS